MKLTVLSQWFDPEPGPAAIPGILGREFVRLGHDVNVLTGFPNYPSGELFPGYVQRRRTVSDVDGMRVTRVRLYPSHDASAVKRIANYTSFGLSALASGRSAFREADAAWVFNSPVTVSMPLLAHTGFGKIPFFLHVQDLWPDSLMHSGMFPGGWLGRRAESVISCIVRLTEKKSAMIGVIAPSVRDLILERHPSIDPRKIVYVPNPTDESLFRAAVQPRDPDGAEYQTGSFELMYVGSVGEVQGLGTVIEAAALLQGVVDVRITIVGDGISKQKLESDVLRRGLTNVRFLGRVPMSEVPGLVGRSDAQLVSLAASEFLKFTMPSKIASLLAMGAPIIGQIAGDGADLIRSAGAGMTSQPGDAAGLAAAIGAVAALSPSERLMLGERGRNFYEQNLSASMAARKIVDSLERHQNVTADRSGMGV